MRGALFALCCATALTGLLAYRLGRRLFPERREETILAWAALVFTAPLLVYSYQAWVEVPAALLLLAALNLCIRPPAADDRAAALRSMALIALLGSMCLLKLRFAPVAASVMVIAWWAPGIRKRHVVALWTLFAVGLATIAGANQYLWGNPLKYRSGEALVLWDMPATDFVKGAVGLFFDSAFGLFPVAPIWMLLIVALPRLGRQRPGLLAALAAISLPYLLFIVPRGRWYGDWSPPFRYPLVLLPLLALAAIPLLSERHRPSAVALKRMLLGATAALTLVWIVVPGMTYSLADGTSTLLRWANHEVGLDVGRFFPSYIRLRLASWIWPPACVVLVALLWSRPRRLARPQLVGTAALVVAILVLALAVHLKPTRVIEVEDTWVRKSTGAPYPDDWNPARASFRGGWGFDRDTVLEIPIVLGKGPLDITVHSRYLGDDDVDRPAALEVTAGDQIATSKRIRKIRWQETRLHLDAWEGEPILRIRTLEQYLKRRVLVIDRIDLEWQAPRPASQRQASSGGAGRVVNDLVGGER